ncbi:MAG: NUDIX domain-containing protein [Pseudomonadota bacterium]
MTVRRIGADTDMTVSAIVQRGDTFLCIEETNSNGIVVNVPGGHIEPGETPEQGIIREVLEETRWHFIPEGFVGAYLWHDQQRDHHFLRLIYYGKVTHEACERDLDEGIVSVHWRTRNELAEDAQRLRAPVVLHCIDDYLKGKRAQFAVTEATERMDIIDSVLPLVRKL